MNGPAIPKRRWADGWGAPALLVVVTVLAFLPSLGGSFVWDDHRFIPDNPNVTKPGSWLAFLTDAGTADPAGALGIVRPLRTLEFALDYAAFDDHAAAFRIHSLLWHIAAAVLFLFIARRLLGDGRAALAAALFWAVHPAQAESVAFISSRGDVAMGACSLAAVLFALRSGGYDRDLGISLGFAALAPLYKEPGVMVCVVVATLRWTKLARAPVWPYFVVAAAYVVYRQSVTTGAMDGGTPFILGGSRAGLIATMIRAFGFYLMETLLPAQSLDWYMTPSTSFADAAVLLWLAVLAALAVSAVVARKRAPVWTLAVVWFAAFFLPVANVPFFLGIPSTERFMYLSLAGAAIAVGWAVARAPRGVAAAAFVVVTALGFACVFRSTMWKSDAALWAAVAADHESPRAHDRFAREARNRGVALQSEALKLPPGPERTEAVAQATVALQDSLDHAHRTLELWCVFEGADRPIGQLAVKTEITASNACYILGRDLEALFHAEEAIRIDPTWDAREYYDRAMPLLQLGFAPQAIASMKRALELGLEKPTEELGRFFLEAAEACRRLDLPATARAAFETAIEAAPDGPLRRAAEAGRDALRDRLAPDAGEAARLARLDEALARTQRSCPAERNRPVAK